MVYGNFLNIVFQHYSNCILIIWHLLSGKFSQSSLEIIWITVHSLKTISFVILFGNGYLRCSTFYCSPILKEHYYWSASTQVLVLVCTMLTFDPLAFPGCTVLTDAQFCRCFFHLMCSLLPFSLLQTSHHISISYKVTVLKSYLRAAPASHHVNAKTLRWLQLPNFMPHFMPGGNQEKSSQGLHKL